MSETAIGCRDFIYDEQQTGCSSCLAVNHCSNANQKSKNSLFKPKLTDLK
jgi:positive regulator of sigma E activity